MDLVAFLDDYHCELVTMSIEQNIARISAFLDKYPGVTFVNRCVVANDDHVVTCFDATLENGIVMSGVEVFKVVDGKVTETWNSLPGSGAWG